VRGATSSVCAQTARSGNRAERVITAIILEWEKGSWGAWWAVDGDVSSDPVTYAIFNPTPPRYFDLWVWSGPPSYRQG